MADQLPTDDEKLRGSIASKILTYGSVVIGIVASIIIIAGIVLLTIANGDPNKTDKAIQLITGIFYALLPVIATWVGTVIAFYFGKANFEAANQSVKDLVQHITNSEQKLKSLKVSDKGVMRMFNDINYNKDIVLKADKEINVSKDLIECIDKNKLGDRLPIFNDKKMVRYIIHESTLNEFARKHASLKYDTLKDKKLEEITLDQMINNTEDALKDKIIKSVSFIAASATLFEANQKLINNPLSQDLFVTQNGTDSEEIIGWITNNKISELAVI